MIFEVFGWAVVPQDFALVKANSREEALMKFTNYVRSLPVDEQEETRSVINWEAREFVFQGDVRIVRGD